ncbi:hypothetical protein A3J61_02250 [Candidatus Nomurabacteria bacterium RIFCSPHIGHO2_02_FULL_38_15]|uniref:PilN domain-containing protein n=1 Tax=Candidatus Nomurabacteria bacterium RIFCSPHIGHO2_02_FULL_38_15 TaxID=1801752 RepID=A0A1F6VQ31_9BACT|nr:MAG: hypothetical protein A3J61_02250 [Candidatus Nomurabacteria bacterium RIFCSPHIGHO2_02_FULL_38_15]
MEPTFQTTFIPKRPMAPISNKTAPSGWVTFLGLIATLVFIASVVAYGILFLYRQQLSGNIVNTNASLTRQSETFDSNIVVELDDVNRRLQSAETLLENHTIITPLFKSLEEITLKTVRFTNFTLQMPTGERASTLVKMSGVAQGYDVIALQSDTFSRNRFFKDPLFSNLVPDQKGNVSFELSFLVDPSFVLYKTYAGQ